MDVLEIGSVPANEDCQQVGTAGYDANLARLECQQYIEQLRRQFGPEPAGCRLYVKSNPHDFGTYLEVACRFNPNCELSIGYAMACEGEAWPDWDETAKTNIDEFLASRV